MLFLGTASFTSLMIGYLVSQDFSLQSVLNFMGIGFVIGGIYFAWVVKNQKVEEIS